MSEGKVGVSVTLPMQMLHRIDRDRGLVPRSVFIVSLVEKAYKQEGRS
jgi:hypothetical protein